MVSTLMNLKKKNENIFMQMMRNFICFVETRKIYNGNLKLDPNATKQLYSTITKIFSIK